MEAARDRLFSKVEKLCPTEEQLADAENDYQRLRLGCWLWKGCCKKGGHGMINVNKKMVLTHRLSYCLHHNKSFDDIKGGVIRHRCDIPNCVNPCHLEDGTQADNVRDMRERGRAVNLKGEENGRSKLTSSQIVAIRADTRSHRKIAADYGVSQVQISNIKRGVSWSSI